MFSNIISDSITPTFVSAGIDTPYAPNVQTLYQTGLIPGSPAAEVQPIDPITSRLDAFAEAGQSRDASMRSDYFNWDKSGAAAYTNDDHFSTIGFNPLVGNITDPATGNSVNPYQIRYQQAADWGDVLSKGAGLFVGLAGLTAKAGLQSDAHLINALFNPFSWADYASGKDTFTSKMMGSPEELMETDKELKDIMNKYHIFQTPETQDGIFNKEFFGDIIGQLGFSAGAAGYMLGTGILMAGFGRLLGSGKTIAAMTRLGKAMEKMKDVGHLDDLKKVENLINSGKTATKIAEDVNMVKKMTDLGRNRSFIQGVVENFTPFYQAITDAKAVKTAGGTGWNMLQASVPGLIKNYTMLSAARAEASIEAAGTYGDLYIGLMDSFYEKEGRMPDATEAANIKNAAYGAATDNYIVNTGLLMTMNSIQFGNMMSKFSSTKRLFRELAEASDDGLMAVKGTLKDGTKDVYRVYNKNAFGGIGAYNKVRKDFGLGTAMYTVLKNNAKHVGKWEVSEGLQELLQEGSNKSLTEYYKNMYHGNKDVDGNILNRVDLAKGLGDQLNKEGWKTFLMGSVTGLFMSPLTSAVMYGKTAGAKALNSNVREAAENKKKTVETNRQLLETFFNNPDTATKGFSRFKEQMKVSKNIGDAAATNDPYMSHNSKDDAISQAAGAAVKAGMLDAFVDNIRMMGDGRFTPEEFMQQFNLTEKVDPKQYADQLATNVEQYYVNWQNLKDRYADLVMPELEKDPAKQLDAIWKKAALNEAIEIMAYNSYHAESAMKRAAEVKTAAGQIPGIGQTTSRIFDLFGNNSEIDKEVKLLQTNLKTLKDTAAGDPALMKQVESTEARIKILEDWKRDYNKMLDTKEESDENTTLKEALLKQFKGYVVLDNILADRDTKNLLDADFEKAFKLLGDYNAINRDYSQYIEIQNLLSNPKNFVTLHSKLFDSMMAAKDIVKEEAKKEADLRADITNGDPVPEDTTKEDIDDDDFADSDVLPVDTYTLVETIDNELKATIEEKKEQLQDKKERLKKEQELSDLLINYPTMDQLSPLQLVRFRGQNGYIERDEETGALYFNGEDGRSFVIDKIDGDYSKPSYEYEVLIVENKEQPTPIEVSEDTEGRVVITMYGTEYVNMYSDPLMAINKDANGNVISVDLNVNDTNKAPRTFKGKNSNLANEIAYNILLHTYEKENSRAREESSSTSSATNAADDINRKEQVIIEGTEQDQAADSEIETNNNTSSTNKEEEELYFLELLLAAKTAKDVQDIVEFLEEDGKEEYSFLLDEAAEKLSKLQEQEEKERLIEEEKKANVVKANKRKEIQKQWADEIAAIKKKYLNTSKNPKTPEELAKKEQLIEAANKKYQALLDALDGKSTTVTTTYIVNQPDKTKIQNINNMNILTLKGTPEQIAAKDAVLRDTTPEELRAGLRIVARRSVDDIERVELPDGKIQLLDKRVTTTVKDLGTFPEDNEDAIQAAIKQAMLPFKKGDYVQQMRSTYTVAVYYRDTLIGYLQPPQQYLFTFNGQLVDVGSLTIEQFKATALIPKDKTADQALIEFKENVKNSNAIWDTLEPLLAAGNMELSGEEIPMKIVPSPGERDFIREKDSIETVRPTLAEVQEQYEIEGIIDSSANEVFYGDASLLEQQPVYAGNLGNYRVAVKLPNGQRVWVQAKGIKMTDSDVKNIAKKINAYFTKIKRTAKDRETLNKLLDTVFITTTPQDGDGIFFDMLISDNGNLALRWYDPFRGANGASGVIDVVRNEVPFTDMDSFTTYLTDVINVAMKSDAAVKKGVMWPEGGVTFTEYNVRKQPNVDALDQMEITSNIGLVKNIGASVIPAAAVPIRNRIEAPIVQENIPEEPAVEGNSSVTVSVAVSQEINGTVVNNTETTVESLNNINDPDALLAALRNIVQKTVPADEVFTGQSVENIGRFSDYIKKNLPAWLTLEEVDSFIDTLYNNNITVGEFMYYLDKTGNVQAVIRTNKDSVGKYHEAFHMVFRLLLPQDTIDRLFSEVAGVYAATPERLQALRESSPIYAEMSEEQLTEALYEEYMADAFDAFRMGRTDRITTGIRGFFNKLTDWINWLWAQFTGADMKGLFYEIESGSFNNSTVQSNQFIKNIGTSANVAKKVIPIGTDIIQTPSGPKEVTKYLPQQEGEIISSTMAALFLKKALLEGSYNTNAVYKEILDIYAAMYNPNDPKYDDRFKAMMRVDKEAAIRWFLRLKERYTLFSSDAGRDALKDAANVYLKIAGIKTDMEEDETEDLTDDYGERNVEDRKRPTTYAALSSFLRMFIGGTTVTYTDEFGNIEFSAGVPLVQSINANKVYNGMIKLLSNQSEGVDMISRMWSMRNDDSNPETAAFIRELIKETGLEYNEETNTFSTAKIQILIQQVIKGFNMFELDHLFVQMDTDNKVRVFSANSQEVAQNQLNAWNADYETRLGNKLVGKTKADIKSIVTAATQGLDGFLATMNTKQALATHLTTPELKDLSKQLSNSIYAGTGIKLSPRYIEYSIAVAKNEDVRTREQRILINGYTDVEPLTAEDVRGIKYSLLKGENIFMETADNLGAIGRLKTMALGNAQFDESVNTMSYQTADGETVYSHTLPSWITVTTNKLNNSRHLEELMQDPDRRSFLLESERFLEQARQRKVKVIGADGLKRVDTFEPGATVDDTGRAITNTDGKVIGDFTGREFLIYLFSTYIKPKNVVTAQSPIEKRTDEDGDTYATESFTTAPVMLRTIEAKNQMFFMELPIVAAVENNRLSQQVLDIMYDMVLQEQQRIARVKEEIKTIADQATRPLGSNEIRVEVKEGYHTGKSPRGLKLFNTALIVGDMAADIEAGKPIDREALTEQLNRYWLAETEALITDMRVLGMIRKESDGSIKNLLAPEYLFKGAQGQAGEYNLEKGNFFHNVMQVFVNDYVNSAAANRLLLGEEAMSFKNTIDQVKRASGWAAAGPDMRVLVTAPEWGINHTLNTFHHFTFADPRFRKMSDGVDKATGDKADAQMYMTEKALRYALFGFGTLNKTQVEALNTLADGNQLSKEAMFGEDGLKKAGAFNSMKLVYFDGQNYLKNSTIALFKGFTSLPDSNGEYTIPFPGREHLHELRLKMEEFEAKSDTIVFGHPVTASKGMKVDIAPTVSAVTDSSFQQLDAQYMRKQVENPSNKIEITAPTQAMIQIMAEQSPNTKVVFLGSEKDSEGKDWTVGRIREIYQESIAQRKTNSFNTAVNDIVNYEEGLVELQTSIDIGKLSPKQGQFIKHAQEMLMATGASSQELGFFELDKNGEPIYDQNFPAVLTKYTQLFLSYFSKGILSEKVPGMSVATVSPWGIRKIKVVKSIWKEGDKGYKKALEGQPRTWKVVTDAEIRANPAAYSNAIDWSTQDEYARRYEGLKEGAIIVDDLRHNYPKYDENGNYLGQFSECLIPAHYKDVMDKIPDALRFMFGIRIPSDDKHSYVALEYVDTLPAQYGSVGVFPQEIIEISGMDFDIDKMYIEMAATYLVGDTRVPYGTAVTLEQQFREYVSWQLENNKSLKEDINKELKTDESLKELLFSLDIRKDRQEELLQQAIDANRLVSFSDASLSIIPGIVETQEQYTYGNEETGYQQGTKNYFSNTLVKGKDYNALFIAAKKEVIRAFADGVPNIETLQRAIEFKKMAITMQNFLDRGMPVTSEQFRDRGGVRLNNGVLTNRALSAKLAMLNNDDIALDTEEQLSILNQGTSVDILSSLVDDLVVEFTAMQSNESIPAADKKNITRVLKVLQEPDVNVDSLRGKLASNMNNKEGSRNIGAAVLSMLVFSTLNQHNMTLSSKDYQLSFNNQDYLSFINTKTSDGARKFAQISAIVNAMTDNAKERLAAKLGLNIEAVGYVSTMVSLGVPIKTATLMMLQPIVRTYFKQLQATKGSVKTDEEKKIRASTLLINMIDSVKNIGGVELTDTNMVSNIAGGDNNTAVSASAIRMLYKVDQVSQNIAQIAKVTRLQKGLPKTWEEVGSILTAVASLSDPMTPAPIPFYDVIDTDPIMSTNIRILQQIDSIAPAFFTEKTAVFKNITDIIHANFEPERMVDRDRYTATVKNDLLSFLAIKAYMHDMATKPEVIDSLRHSLIYPTAGQQTIVDIVKELRELISTEGSGRNRKNLMLHKFLNAVDAKITETGIDELRVNNWTKLSEGYIESLAGAFVDLYSNSITDKNNKPLNTHTQAIAIFNYLLVKDGGQFKNNSFIRYIPPFVFMDLLSSSKKVNEMMKIGYRATEEDYMRVFGATLQDVRKQFVDSYGMHTNNFYNIKKVSGVQGAVTVNSTGIKINTTTPPAVKLETIGGFSYTTDINEATGAKVVIYMLPYYVKILDKLYKLSTVDGAAVSTGSSTPIQTGTTAEYTLVYGGSRGSKSTSIMTGVFGELPMRPGIQPAATQGQTEVAPVPTAVDLKDKGTPIKRVIGDRYVNEYADGTIVEVENDGSRDIPDAYYDIFADPAANDSFVPQEEFFAPFEEESARSAQPVETSSIKQVYNSNTEIQKIGTTKEYEEYVNNIFPASKVKEVLYHGTRGTELFPVFRVEQADIRNYGSTAIFLADEKYASTHGKTIPVVINAKNPLDVSGNSFMRRRLKQGFQQPIGTRDARDILAENTNNDSLIGTDYNESDYKQNKTVVVKTPQQIHILGTAADVKGFKNWKEGKQIYSIEDIRTIAIEAATTQQSHWSTPYILNTKYGSLKTWWNRSDMIKEITKGLHDDALSSFIISSTKSQQPVVSSQTMRQTDLFAPQQTISDSSIKRPFPGVENIPDTGLTTAQANEFIALIQPQILNQAYIENKARTANRMFSFGLRWAKKIPNETERSKQRVAGSRTNKVAIKGPVPTDRDPYGYYKTDQNNNPLPTLGNLEPIIEFIESKLGIDMSNYDSVLANIYESGSFIHQHRDTTESESAKKYPVIVLNLGADGNLIYHTEFSDETKYNVATNTYNKFEVDVTKHSQLPIKNGGIYAFGVGGVNRFTFNHRVSENTQNTVTKPITVPVWDAEGNKTGEQQLKNYRITLTFRRAQDITEDVPKEPKRIGSSQTIEPVQQPTAVQLPGSVWKTELAAIYKEKKLTVDEYTWTMDKIGLRDGRRVAGIPDTTILEEIKAC